MGLLRSLPPAATERLSELTLLLPELPSGDYSFSEVGTPSPPPQRVYSIAAAALMWERWE